MDYIKLITEMITDHPDVFCESDTNKLQKKLKMLELDYFDQPSYLRKKDLVVINKIRTQLGMPQVGPNLKTAVEKPAEPAQTPKPTTSTKPKVDKFKNARKIYQAYQQKMAMLKPHREYCTKLIKELNTVAGKTPVRPLATMGTNNGPILCDYCEKPFRLEGGHYNGVDADKAWEASGGSISNSYILKHITILQETNGTFRAYHGHEGSGHTIADQQEQAKKEQEWKKTRTIPTSKERKELNQFLLEEKKMTDKEKRDNLTAVILREVYAYDPGIGVNRP